MLAQQRGLRFVGAQPRFVFRDIFFARAEHRQIQGLLVHRELCHGNFQARFGGVDVLLAHGPAAGGFRGVFQPLVLPLRIDQIGLGRLDIGARLRDLFRPAAVAQPGYDLLLRRRLRCHLGNLRLETAGIQVAPALGPA